jgi:general secretion pathway protein J
MNDRAASRNRRILFCSHHGFTLIEILIAISILGIVLTTIYASYSGTFRVIRSAQENSELYGMARSTLARISKDLGCLTPLNSAYVMITKAYTLRNQECIRLTFRSSAHIAFSDRNIVSGVATIGYEIVEDANREGFVLIRTDVLTNEMPKAELMEQTAGMEDLLRSGFILCTDLHSMNFKFFDADGKEYDAWDSVSGGDKQNKQAPAMILITLNMVNPNDKEHPFPFMTRIFLPARKVEM